MDKGSFDNYLKRMFVEVFSPRYFGQHGETPDEHDFAVFLGISDQAYSQYKLGKRRPTLAVVEKIADKLKDPAAYDAAGYPRRMPRDPFAVMLMDNLVHLTDQDREEIKKLIEQRREEKESRKKSKNSSAYA